MDHLAIKYVFMHVLNVVTLKNIDLITMNVDLIYFRLRIFLLIKFATLKHLKWDTLGIFFGADH